MSAENPSFVSWEEHIICHERGNRVVHFFLKDTVGDLVLAVIGTERSIRHMMYVVTDEFVQAYGSSRFINMSIKWRARREVVDWLASVISQCRLADAQMNDTVQELGPHDARMTESTACPTTVADILIPRKLKVRDMNIEWSGVAWTCAKQLKHYPSCFRNDTTITVHSFVSLVAEEENYYLGYLEDMYEDKKGQKKVKVRWFLHNQEVKDLITDLNPHPSEVFITAHVQVINAECIDGLATVLTPKHYERCVSLIPQTSSSSIHMCLRQIKHNRVKPFTLTKLRGYSNQAILIAIDDPPPSKQKIKGRRLNEEDEEWSLEECMRMGAKRRTSSKEHRQLNGSLDFKNPFSAKQFTNGELKYPKLKLKLSRKTMGNKAVLPEPQLHVSFKVDEKIELLCQDSGIRGCWFRCKVLRVSRKLLKVEYDDLEDADGQGNLQEWVPASRMAASDKLGMRCPGRLTIRPFPPGDPTGFDFEVGSPVDAWWSDGWWEGVVTGVDISGKDGLQIYLPGEDKFLTVQRKDIRASKDWVDNKWVDVNPNPDILSYISANFISSLKLSACSTVGEPSGSGSSALLEHKVLKTSKLETVKEDEQELATDDQENVKVVNIKNQLYVHDEYKMNKHGGGDIDENVANKDAGNKAKAVSEEAGKATFKVIM